MIKFKIFTQSDILSLTQQRVGETKLGEKVDYLRSTEVSQEALEKSDAKFVILGIPEDIGVRANYGIGGTNTVWKPALRAFLNTQQNTFIGAGDILVLGEFEFEEQSKTDVQLLREVVSSIDNRVYPLIKIIVAAGKIPILIGGGHNNCYPIIKGVSLALDTPINTLNIDAHADLRATDEGRHSGNGFSTAIRDKYLSEYRIFGLHKSYLSEAQHSFINQHKSIQVRYFDDLIASKSELSQALEELIAEVEKPLGLEIDLDSICGALASAASPSGFTLNELRQIILNTKREFAYLHICEGAYQLNDGRSDNNIGKTIAYLISDFIRATNNI